MTVKFKLFIVGFACLFSSYVFAEQIADKNLDAPDTTFAVRSYINATWNQLLRTNSTIGLSSSDVKIAQHNLIVYVSRRENIRKVRQEFAKALAPNLLKKITIKYLPSDIANIKEHGLLYLPHPYIVPGGRFNEMYGWDSYFIELGLLENKRLDLARNMVENLLYEVQYYGTVLNANRTYYLQRSNPPLLSEMVLAYYERVNDKKWLATTLPTLMKLHQYWITAPHLIPKIGLSRYYAGGNGPAPEESPVYYQKAREYFKQYYIGDYDKNIYYDVKKNQLRALFYIADRTVRESGFDITAKYGPFSASILDYAPVDLNVLLYQMEKDIATINKLLGYDKMSAVWLHIAAARSKAINQYMWNNTLGYYFDYNFKTDQQRPYVYATTFYPLWAGVASKAQAKSLVNNLPILLGNGGIVTSAYRPGLQWDAPFGWAPMQYFAVKGLIRYGYKEEASEIAQRFIRTINKQFEETHQLYEKYDVQLSSNQMKGKILYGYNTNEIGFGWTNGVYLKFANYLDHSKNTV